MVYRVAHSEVTGVNGSRYPHGILITESELHSESITNLLEIGAIETMGSNEEAEDLEIKVKKSNGKRVTNGKGGFKKNTRTTGV